MKTHMLKLTSQPIIHILAISCILFILGWVNISPLVFSTSDAGLRFWQIHSLVINNWQTLAIDYTTELDPAYRYVPFYYAYSLIDGRLFFDISPFYPLLASFLYAGIGKIGLVISPIIGSILTIWGLYRLAVICNLRRPDLMMWATIFATPILFYSIQVWDHTFGTGLAVLGLAFALEGVSKYKNSLIFLGGMIIGLSVGQRPELYVFAGAIGIAWLAVYWRVHRYTAVLIVGGIMGVLPVWIAQQLWVGHPLGLATATHLLGYGRPESYLAQPAGRPKSANIGNFLFHIDARDPVTFTATLMTIMGIGLLFFALRVPRYQTKTTLWVGTLLIMSGAFIWGYIAWGDLVTGLISTFPLFGLSVAYVSRDTEPLPIHRIYQVIFITVFVYTAAMLAFWPAFGSRIWGARYLLTAYPLLIWLAFYSFSRYTLRLSPSLSKTYTVIFTTLLVTSIGMQLLGFRFNYRVVNSLSETKEALINLPVDAVITNQPFWPALIGPTAGKDYYYVQSQADLDDLLIRLHDNGVSRFTFVLLQEEQLVIPVTVHGIQVQQFRPFSYHFVQE